MDLVTVYREPGRFAGWPANYGIWGWGDEIVTGFTTSILKADAGFHARDRSRPADNLQARSMDGGRTWTVGAFPGHRPGGRAVSADEHMVDGLKLEEVLRQPGHLLDLREPIDFTHPDFALMCARTGLEPGVQSFFYFSYDRARTWNGPFRLPQFVYAGVAARTDYIVTGKHSCMLFLTGNRFDGDEGKVFCVETRDGGQTWTFVNWVGSEPDVDYRGIMPSSLLLPGGDLLTAVRSQRGMGHSIELYRSADMGRSWGAATVAVAFEQKGKNHLGNPPALTRLADGRLVLAYGNRAAPYTMEARVSTDEGRSWSAPMLLRQDGGSHDLGYPRTAIAADGTIVTVYYFNEGEASERFIGATRWTV